MNHTLKVHLALFFATLIYSINYVIAKIITPEYILPFGIIVMRVFGAGILFWYLHKITLSEKIKSRTDFIRILYAALFGVVFNQLLFFKGLSITSSINSAIIMTSTPILVLISSSFLLKEKVTSTKLLGIILGISGAILLMGGNNLSFQKTTILGDILIFLNASAYGIYLVLVKPLMKTYHPLTVIKWIFLLGAVGVFPFGIRDLILLDWIQLPWFVYVILAYIIVFTTFFAYLLNAWGLKYVNATVVGFYIYLQPVLTSLIAVLSGREMLTWQKTIFSLIIFIGVYLVSKD